MIYEYLDRSAHVLQISSTIPVAGQYTLYYVVTGENLVH